MVICMVVNGIKHVCMYIWKYGSTYVCEGFVFFVIAIILIFSNFVLIVKVELVEKKLLFNKTMPVWTFDYRQISRYISLPPRYLCEWESSSDNS